MQVAAARPDQRPHQRHRQPRAQPTAQRHQRAVGDERRGVVQRGPLVPVEVEGTHQDRPPPVDDQRGTGHVAQPPGREHGDRVGDVVGLGDPSGRDARFDLFPQLRHVEPPLRHGRAHEAGADGVGPDPGGGVVGGQRLREHQRRALRRGVGAPAGERDLARHRRHRDDVPAALGQHHRQRRPRAQERAAGVDREHPVPLLHRGLVAGRGVDRAAHAGVVDQHVDAPERLDDLRERRVHRVPVGDVGRAPEPVGSRGDLGGLAVDVEHGEGEPVGGEPGAGRPPDARAAAGHHRDPGAHAGTGARCAACAAISSGS